jgi:cystathionine gamma-synthase
MRDLLTDPLWRAEELGLPIPEIPHAVSVCIPRWEDAIAYEECDPAVLDQFRSGGYPRFVVHPLVRGLFDAAMAEFGKKGEVAMVFPSVASAWRCAEYVRRRDGVTARLENFGWAGLTAVLVPETAAEAAWKYWQHGGEIVSSRVAEAILVEAYPEEGVKSMGGEARSAVRERLAAISCVHPDDVFLFGSGMAAIFAVHRALGQVRPGLRTAQVEFPYVDALKVQQQFGRGAHDFSVADDGGVSDVKRVIESGEPLAGVFTEVPSNPLLRTADLAGLAELLRRQDTPLIVDDTVVTAMNVDALQFADAVTTSLTKFVSGVGDVMAGAVTLNPGSPIHEPLSKILAEASLEAPLFALDAIVLEENSRDFESRAPRVNANAEAIYDFLADHPKVARIWYPKNETPEFYRSAMRDRGGFGGLMSILLDDSHNASPRFFDALEISKGPSLGTNFSLACPYTLLAHYRELPWAESCGVSRNLIRIWTGLEPPEELLGRLEKALVSA